MMTQDDQQNDSKPVPGYNKPQQLTNKYDEQNFSSNNRINMHPSRSFKYLQRMTSDDQDQPPSMTTTVTRTGNETDLFDNHLTFSFE